MSVRDSFIFYRSFAEGIKHLEPREQYIALWDIINYALDDRIPDGNEDIPEAIFCMARPQIDENNKRFVNGSKGGRPKKTDGYETEKPMVFNSETYGYEDTKPNVNVNDNVNVNVNDNENVKEKKKSKKEKYFSDDEELNQAFEDYIDMRKKIKKPMTEKAIGMAITKLQKLSSQSGIMDNDLAIDILNQSTMNSWLGLFPLSGNRITHRIKPSEDNDNRKTDNTVAPKDEELISDEEYERMMREQYGEDVYIQS